MAHLLWLYFDSSSHSKAPAMHINDKLRRAVLVGQLRKYRRRITTVGICMLELGRGGGVWLGLELLV